MIDDDVRYVRVRGGFDETRNRWVNEGIDLDGDGIADLQLDTHLQSELI